MKKLNMKTVLLIVALLMVTTVTTRAQVFIDDDEFGGTMRQELEDGWTLVTPAEGLDTDQFTPLDGGWLLMTGLGVSYLLSRRKKGKDTE